MNRQCIIKYKYISPGCDVHRHAIYIEDGNYYFVDYCKNPSEDFPTGGLEIWEYSWDDNGDNIIQTLNWKRKYSDMNWAAEFYKSLKPLFDKDKEFEHHNIRPLIEEYYRESNLGIILGDQE